MAEMFYCVHSIRSSLPVEPFYMRFRIIALVEGVSIKQKHLYYLDISSDK